MTQALVDGDRVDLCRVSHEEFQRVGLDMDSRCSSLASDVEDSRVYEQSAGLECEWFGLDFSSSMDWADSEEPNERSVYEQTPLSLLDYQSTVAPSRPDLSSKVLTFDTYYETEPQLQTKLGIRERRERRQRWLHHEANPKQLTSSCFVFNGTEDDATCSWCVDYLSF